MTPADFIVGGLTAFAFVLIAVLLTKPLRGCLLDLYIKVFL